MEGAAERWDEVELGGVCRRCGVSFSRALTVVDGVPYASLDALRNHVRRLASRFLVEERCECGAMRQVAGMTYVVAHGELGQVTLRASRGLLGVQIKAPELDARALQILRRDALLRRCHLLLARGQAGLARPAIAAAVRELRGDAGLLTLGSALYAAGEVEAALRLCEACQDSASSANSVNPAALSLLGQVTLEAVRLGLLPSAMRMRAELHLADALDRRPDDVVAAKTLARAQAARGKLHAARSTLERALSANPDALELRVELGTLAADDPQIALAAVDAALALQPNENVPQLLDTRVRTLVRLGRVHEAHAAVAELTALSPRFPSLRELTGLVARALVANRSGPERAEHRRPERPTT